MIDKMKRHLKGEGRKQKQQGTLLNIVASMAATDGYTGMLHTIDDQVALTPPTAKVQFPKQSSIINLRNCDLYIPVFNHLRTSWQDVHLIPDTAPLQYRGERFVAAHVTSYSHLFVNGIRYGTAHTHRGQASRYAYINGRTPVEIQNLLHVVHRRPHTSGAHSLEADVAVVRPFVELIDVEGAPYIPWRDR